MNTRIRKPRNLPIGIDVGTQCLKAAQVRQSPNNKLTLLAWASRELPADSQTDIAARSQAVCEAMRHIGHAQHFKGNQCILSLPAELTFVQHMKMNKMPPDQLAGSLQWELASKLPFDPAEAEIRHVVAGDIYVDNQPQQEVIAVAARRDTIEAHVEALRRAKLECIGVNVEPCAIVECFARLFRRSHDGERALLFVDIGATSTQVVVSHGPNLVFAKNLAFGGSHFDQALGADLENAADPQVVVFTQALTGPIGTLSQELTNCLRYYDSVFINRPIERVVFLGGEAHDKPMCQTLAQRLGLPAQIGDPLTQIELDPRSTTPSDGDYPAGHPNWAVAVGLSLGGAIRPKSTRAA